MVFELVKLYTKSKIRNPSSLRALLISFVFLCLLLISFYNADTYNLFVRIIYQIETPYIFISLFTFDLLIKLILKDSFFYNFSYLLLFPVRKKSIITSFALIELFNRWTVFPVIFIAFALFNNADLAGLYVLFLVFLMSVCTNFTIETVRIINRITKRNILSFLILLLYVLLLFCLLSFKLDSGILYPCLILTGLFMFFLSFLLLHII